jgi:hypothetical protein
MVDTSYPKFVPLLYRAATYCDVRVLNGGPNGLEFLTPTASICFGLIPTLCTTALVHQPGRGLAHHYGRSRAMNVRNWFTPAYSLATQTASNGSSYDAAV